MKFRTTLLAALLLALFGAYFYFFEYKKAREKEETEEREKKVFSLEWDRIRGLRLAGSHGAFVLEKQPKTAGEEKPGAAGQGEWRIVEPVRAEADGTVLNGMVNSLKDLKIDQVVAENPEALAPFGLEEPKLQIEILVPEGETRVPPLRVGSKSPVGPNAYGMREGENKVLLLSASLDSQFDKGLFELREKRLFPFSKDDVEGLRILKQGQPRVEISREQNQWQLTRPLQAPASEEEVSKILNKLTGLRAQSFEAEQAADLAPLGLSDPAWTVEVVLSPDHTRASLLLAGTGPGKGKAAVYAKRGETPAVVTLNPDVLETLAVDPGQLREKKVFSFKSWDVEKVELTLNGQPVALEKTEAGKWWIKAPIEARAAAGKISPFLSSLSRLEGEEFIKAPGDENGLAAYGLSPPLAAIAVFAKGEKSPDSDGGQGLSPLGRVLIGRSGGDAGVYYATREGSGTIARVGKDFFEQDLPRNLEDLRDRKLLDIYRYQVQAVEVQGAEGTVALTRSADGWELEQPEERRVEDQEVEDLLTVLTDLEVLRFVDAGGQGAAGDETAFPGPGKPALRITLKGDKGEALGTLLVSDKGPETDPGLVFVGLEGDKRVGLIEEARRKELSDKVRPFLRREG